MNTYIINFVVYTFSMIGFLLVILFVYKKSIKPAGEINKKNFLKVENTLKLSPVKTVYVLKAGNERFLIAGDTANTTMLAKLENNTEVEEVQEKESLKFEPFKVLQMINRG